MPNVINYYTSENDIKMAAIHWEYKLNNTYASKHITYASKNITDASKNIT